MEQVHETARRAAADPAYAAQIGLSPKRKANEPLIVAWTLAAAESLIPSSMKFEVVPVLGGRAVIQFVGFVDVSNPHLAR